MIAYRLLSNADFDSLHECFLTAFSDYEVDMRMSRQRFQQRLTRDGIRLEISAGAFDGDRMIGFCINAIGQWQGKTTAYDGGSAMIPEYRGRGIATEMFAFLEPNLKEAGVVQYLLEVLTSNVPAANLYRKLGFVETRRLAVFRSQRGTRDTEGTKDLRPMEQPDWELFQSFWDGYPSWQNSSDAVDRAANERIIMGAYTDDVCVGYGVVFVPQMNVMQLAVSSKHRRQGIGSALLAALETSGPLRIINIDEDLKGTLAFYEHNGYRQVFGQYEMIKIL
jgi:ribosomal protein S18 acetylase RimI-like enzyme